MSRKRGKDKQAKPSVPDEILAEGSGPNEVIEADAQALADAAAKAVQSKRGRKAKQVVDAWGQPIDEVAADEPGDETIEESAVETAPAPEETTSKPSKRSRKSKAKSDAPPATESVDVADEGAAVSAAADDGESLEVTEDESSSEEAQSEQALEDAVLQAEAEAELSAAGEGGEGGEGGEDVDAQGAALPTTAASMDAARLKNLVEALVFAADKPVTLQRLRQLTRVSEVKRLEQALTEIAADYTNRGIALQQVSGGYQFRTNTQYSVWVQQLIAGRPVRLSRAQLETLAIVAYRQPITRPEVDEIRGVDSSATLRLLLERSLIRVLGKKEEVGRPVLYGTTKEFLDFFSLSDLRELPTLREYSELTAESRKVMSDRLGIDADGNPVDEDGNPVDADGNPIDDGTDVLPDAPVDSMEASVDPGAEDDAAIEAVSAVAQVIGMEEERFDATVDDESSSTTTTDEPSSDAHVEASASDGRVEASASDELSSDEPIEASASDDRVEASVSDDRVEASASDELSSDEPIEASASVEPVEVSTSDESSRMSSDERVDASAVEAAASDEPSRMSSDEAVEAAASDEPSRDESIEASASDDHVLATAGDASSDEPVGAMDEQDDAMSMSGEALDQGMPRGASQEDVVGLSDEATSDSEDRALEASSEDPGDEAAPDSESPSAELLDASSSESLDDTDKSPAE